MDPFFHTGLSISDSLKTVRKSVLIYETIIPASNALLGEYFRNRLGLANGAYVTAADLRSYGRTDVTFIKIDEEHYYMDFSI